MTVRAVLDQVNVVVVDMEAMAEFYGRLGLELRSGLPQWAPHHRQTERENAGVHLALDSRQFAAMWNQGWRGEGGIVLGFRVPSRDDVDGLYDELTSAGYSGQQAPYDAFWGARYAVVSDPDGNSVGLMSPTDAAFQLPPPTTPD
ncbi:MAG TPA: VOC family protein [Acidimicrobiales bacterium]|nr:VOC family protein [Acidimicrobiales bacterium]